MCFFESLGINRKSVKVIENLKLNTLNSIQKDSDLWQKATE